MKLGKSQQQAGVRRRVVNRFAQHDARLGVGAAPFEQVREPHCQIAMHRVVRAEKALPHAAPEDFLERLVVAAGAACGLQIPQAVWVRRFAFPNLAIHEDRLPVSANCFERIGHRRESLGSRVALISFENGARVERARAEQLQCGHPGADVVGACLHPVALSLHFETN